MPYKDPHSERAKEGYRKRQARYRASGKYREQLNRRNFLRRQNSLRIRQEVIDHYGGKCACCGEKELVFLTIDHINGGGKQQRKEIGGGAAICQWLKSHNYPEGYQVLCFNCNCAKRDGKVCPHQAKKEVN